MAETVTRKDSPKARLRRIEALLGPGAATLLGAATGFFCFAMPARIVFSLISALGLPPAVAESRAGLALALALLVGAATWAGFRWLDRAAARPGAQAVAEGAAPVLRRADAHPDAPARRPIFAGSDLGTPLDLIDPLPVDWEASAPAWREAEIALAPARREAAPMAIFPPEPLPVLPSEPAAALIVAPVPIAAAQPRHAAPRPSLSAMMGRLELGLARKALALGGDDTNVTPLKREIRPVGGSLSEAVEALQRRTAERR